MLSVMQHKVIQSKKLSVYSWVYRRVCNSKGRCLSKCNVQGGKTCLLDFRAELSKADLTCDYFQHFYVLMTAHINTLSHFKIAAES